ncbi:hypothetical protein WJX73_002673 [Symbiochloris irregularis]|uniref:Uncharacterized protein n=1 Tax=Symbiochloris irregularis TaxID=706552 RepID=A0AAW1PZC7_9CHLO
MGASLSSLYREVIRDTDPVEYVVTVFNPLAEAKDGARSPAKQQTGEAASHAAEGHFSKERTAGSAELDFILDITNSEPQFISTAQRSMDFTAPASPPAPVATCLPAASEGCEKAAECMDKLIEATPAVPMAGMDGSFSESQLLAVNGTALPSQSIAQQTKGSKGGAPKSSSVKGKLKGAARKMKSSTAALKRLVGHKLNYKNTQPSTTKQARSKQNAYGADLIGLGPLAAAKVDDSLTVPSPAKYPRTCAVKEHQRFIMSQDGYFRPVLVKGNPKVPGIDPLPAQQYDPDAVNGGGTDWVIPAQHTSPDKGQSKGSKAPSIGATEGTNPVNTCGVHDLQGAQSMAKGPEQDPFALPFCTLGLYEIFLDVVYSEDGQQLEGFTMHASTGLGTVKTLRDLYEGAGVFIPPLIMVPTIDLVIIRAGLVD